MQTYICWYVDGDGGYESVSTLGAEGTAIDILQLYD